MAVIIADFFLEIKRQLPVPVLPPASLFPKNDLRRFCKTKIEKNNLAKVKEERRDRKGQFNEKKAISPENTKTRNEQKMKRNFTE